MNTKQLLQKKKIPAGKQEYFLIYTQNRMAKNYSEHSSQTADKDPETEILCFEKIFGNKNPVVLEIGSGRGELIAKLSEDNPDCNYLGIELSGKRIASILRKIEPDYNPNVRLIKAKVDLNFLDLIPDRSLAQVLIFHPDPWPKRKHHKNRLINNMFINNLAGKIKPEGEVLICTDNEDYAFRIMHCFSNSECYKSIYKQGHSREPFWNDVSTHFETKMTSEGYKPYYMRYKLNR